MKLFAVLSVAAATMVAVAAPAQRPERPIVVIVHGRGHAEGDSAALRRQWKRALDSTVASLGTRFADDDVHLAWYADALLSPELAGWCRRSVPDSTGLDALAGMLGFLMAGLPKDESRETRALMGDLMWVVDPRRRCTASFRVQEAVTRAFQQKRPVIVIGYSLGSVVAYNALSLMERWGSEPPLHFITIGSPMGNPVLSALLGQTADTLRRPRIVTSWQNVYDPTDPFASPLAGASVRDALRDDPTENDTRRDPHDIERYFSDRAMVAAMTRVLCVTKGTESRSCAR